MLTQGHDLGDGLSFSDNPDGDVQFIDAPKVDQSKFMTPTRILRQSLLTPLFHPGYLTQLVRKGICSQYLHL